MPNKLKARPINVRFTDEERNEIAAQANAAGMSLSQWVRRKLLQPNPQGDIVVIQQSQIGRDEDRTRIPGL